MNGKIRSEWRNVVKHGDILLTLERNAPVEEYLLDGGSPRASEDSVVASGAETLHRED